ANSPAAGMSSSMRSHLLGGDLLTVWMAAARLSSRELVIHHVDALNSLRGLRQKRDRAIALGLAGTSLHDLGIVCGEAGLGERVTPPIASAAVDHMRQRSADQRDVAVAVLDRARGDHPGTVQAELGAVDHGQRGAQG